MDYGKNIVTKKKKQYILLKLEHQIEIIEDLAQRRCWMCRQQHLRLYGGEIPDHIHLVITDIRRSVAIYHVCEAFYEAQIIDRLTREMEEVKNA